MRKERHGKTARSMQPGKSARSMQPGKSARSMQPGKNRRNMQQAKKRRSSGRERRNTEETSLRGKIVRDLIAQAASERMLGDKIKSGELRIKASEREHPWRCPFGYTNTVLELPDFKMDFLQPEKICRRRVVLQLHGGGYVAAMRNAYRSMAVLYSEEGGGIPVLTIDYRVAPENPYPAALMDAAAAYDWLLAHGYAAEDIIVAGDSAGGGLALALCLWLRDQGRRLPRGVIAMSPWADLTASGESYDSNYELDPLFGKTRNSLIYRKDYIGEEDPENPYISPMFGEYHRFPPLLVQVGSYEMLLSDSLTVADKAKRAGVRVRLSCYPGMFHVFQLAMRTLPESARAWVEVGEFFRAIG